MSNSVMRSAYEDPADRPLFGDSRRPTDRVLNLIVGVFTSLIVVITLISAFIFPSWPPNGINVFFAIIIVLICCSHSLLIYWYRQGDLEPKFRNMIFYNAFTIILLCVCGNLYIHEIGVSKSR
ncbi:transmembrane protein 243-like [Pomacea canaliculata]|uniref:transmembrane protein 243-like n=1 Tax=Pomacea canaliculata TaxID=400727 RepID=UPI000D727BD3|nr:transmembrane protein 243-like [Pomacea canaliculata]